MINAKSVKRSGDEAEGEVSSGAGGHESFGWEVSQNRPLPFRPVRWLEYHFKFENPIIYEFEEDLRAQTRRERGDAR